MGLANDYETAAGEEGSDDEGISDEQYRWLQEQLAHIGQLRIEDDEEEKEWVDPSGGLLVNIYAACEEGDTEKLAINLADLQQTEHSIDTPGPDGDAALHLACLYGNKPCVEALIAAGCKLDPINREDGTSPLHDAAAGGYLGIAQLLLDKAGPAMVTQQDADGDTPLHNAARGGHLRFVQYLLELGADPSAVNGDGKTPAAESEEADVVAALVAAAATKQRQPQQPAAAKDAAAAATADTAAPAEAETKAAESAQDKEKPKGAADE